MICASLRSSSPRSFVYFTQMPLCSGLRPIWRNQGQGEAQARAGADGGQMPQGSPQPFPSQGTCWFLKRLQVVSCRAPQSTPPRVRGAIILLYTREDLNLGREGPRPPVGGRRSGWAYHTGHGCGESAPSWQTANKWGQSPSQLPDDTCAPRFVCPPGKKPVLNFDLSIKL